MELYLALALVTIVIIFVLLLRCKKSEQYVVNYRMKDSQVPIVMYDNKFINKIPEFSVAVPNSMSQTRDLQIYELDDRGTLDALLSDGSNDPTLKYLEKNKNTPKILLDSGADREKTIVKTRVQQ